MPSRIILGAAFTLWMLLLLAQTSLVAAHRTDIHKRLGIAAFALGCVMVVLGVLAGTDVLVRNAAHLVGGGVEAIAEGGGKERGEEQDVHDLHDVKGFGIAAERVKRFILLANTSLMIAAIARWPVAFTHRNNPMDALVSELFLLLLTAYDYWPTRKLHRATLPIRCRRVCPPQRPPRPRFLSSSQISTSRFFSLWWR